VFTTREVRSTILLTATSTDQFPTYNFKLSDLNNYVDFVEVFDEYKIDAVSMTIKSLNGTVGLYTNSSITLVDLYSVIDYNDTTAFTLTSQARQFENCMTLMPGESCNRVFAPKPALAVYEGAFTGYASGPKVWINTDNPNVQHYGMKLAIGHGGVSQTQNQTWEVEFEYYVSFRSVR